MVKRTSPFRTSWPSLKCTRCSSPPTWARTDTTAKASTVPIAWICSAIVFCSTGATDTGTGGDAAGAFDSALSREQAPTRV